ncbi:pyridoxamine 5'-phosphate oxidase family protein [Ovoidimarina sediminis]|uniref:pyridoxamine 5'-phosphate oxidase family protein n=1 Tax=Ovoidimarina sediminis TaxID=3079856 RepID=UPI002907F08B|nr:pyridoxamine 5'-phosphate oxidase family protein [Rhodophyticola sp. MJ-SS7]MDU8942315.1 pyridoxamine 5'-phosphate oxidase family protein [Rhodophyticola sp. MJ-SS7]
MALAFAEISFTPAVRRRQERHGSGSYARFLSDDRQGGARLGEAERAFIEARDGFYQATVSETGWPYVQFRGGPPGFLRAIDDRTIAYADLRGNRQYISVGNLDGNDRIALILMDYAHARRLKIWGRAETFEAGGIGAGSPDPPAERAVIIHVEAFDWNCPRHIPRRLTEAETQTEIAALRRENAALKAETLALSRAAKGSPTQTSTS